MLRRCSRFVAVTSSAFLSLCASAPAQSTGAPGGKAPPKLVLFMVIYLAPPRTSWSSITISTATAA